MSDTIVVEHDQAIYSPVREAVYAVFSDAFAKLSTHRVIFWKFTNEKYQEARPCAVISLDATITEVDSAHWDNYLGLLFPGENLETRFKQKAISYAVEECGTSNLELLAEAAE